MLISLRPGTLALLATLAVIHRPALADEVLAGDTPAAKPAENSAEKPAEEKPAAKTDTRGVTPAEFAGPALPRERSGAMSQIDRARELFAEKKWAEGLDIFDSLLAEERAAAEEAKETEEAESGDEDAPAEAVARPRLLAGALPAVRIVGAAAAAPAAAAKKKADAKKQSPPSQTVFTDDGVHYRPIERAVRRILLELEPEARQVYADTYEAPAKKMLDEALALPFAESLDALAATARRYPLTPSGLEGLRHYAARAFDLGAPARAEVAYGELIALRRSLEELTAERETELAGLSTKRLVASILAGRRATADRLATAIEREFTETFVSIGGEPVRGAEIREAEVVARLLRRDEGDASGDAGAWTCPGGRPDHLALDVPVDAHPVLGSRARWIHFFDAGASAPDPKKKPSAASLRDREPLRRSSFYSAYPSTRVATSGDAILVRSRGELAALDASSGKIRWRTNLLAIGSRVGAVAGAGTAAFQNLGGNSISVVGDVAMIIDAEGKLTYKKNSLSYSSNALLAFDVRSGKLRWRLGSSGANAGGPEETSPLDEITFTAPPTHAGGDLLVAPATEDDGPSVVGLTTSGEVRWIEKLYNYNTGYLQQHRNAVSQGASLAVADGVAVAAPGHGVVTAIDVDSGRIRWITRYRTLGYTASRYSTVDVVWAPAQPIIADGVALVAPYDSAYLMAIDIETGETLWDRDHDGDNLHLVGARADLAYVAGDRVEAIDTRSGDVRWTATGLETSAGRGFVTSSRIHLPLERGVAVLDAATGEVLERLGFTDSRIPDLKPANLSFIATPDGSRLIAAGAWGVALVKPQDATRGEFEARRLRQSFERARVLRAEGRYDEASELLVSLLRAAKLDDSIATARRLLIETAREAADRSGDPAPLVELLETPGVELDTTVRISLQLAVAALLERDEPRAAAGLYREIAASARAAGVRDLVVTPSGTMATPDAHCEGALLELARSHDEIELGTEELKAAREELARRASEAAERGDLAAIPAYLQRLERRHGTSIDGPRSRYERAVRDDPMLPEGLHAVIADESLEWKQLFWKGVDEGFMVETMPGSAPLGGILALKGGKLLVHDLKGEKRGEVDLPDYPDIEQAKAGLKSHIEEPGALLSRGEDGVLFTAAGVYRLDLGGELPRVGWRQNVRHAIESLHSLYSRRGWGSNTLSKVAGNLFPRFLVTPDQRLGLVLEPDGNVFAVELSSGKIHYRFEGKSRPASGEPGIVGHDLVTSTAKPAGVVVFDLLKETAYRNGLRPSAVKYATTAEGTLYDLRIVPGLAVVLDSPKGIEVRDANGKLALWREDESRRAPSLARVTGGDVWIVEDDGSLTCRELLSGIRLWSLEIPRGAMALGALELDTPGPRSAWLAIAIEGSSPSTRSYTSLTQIGKRAILVRITEEGEKLAERSIGGMGVTFHARRWLAGESWIFAYNAAEDGGRWFSRVAAFAPDTGELRELLRAPIAGKGTGLPPRLAVVRLEEAGALGLALGNAEGYGIWAARMPGSAKMDAEERTETPEKATEKATEAPDESSPDDAPAGEKAEGEKPEEAK